MLVPPIPVSRVLVPPVRLETPEGFTRVDSSITGGLPHLIPLTGNFALTLVVPTGLARAWQDADPAAIVSTSIDQVTTAGTPGATDISSIPPARFLLRRSGTTVASIPLVVGQIQSLPQGGTADRGIGVDLTIISWVILAGSIRGPGDIGSSISFAWRPAGKGTPQFAPPAINRYVLQRWNPEQRLLSDAGYGAAWYGETWWLW